MRYSFIILPLFILAATIASYGQDLAVLELPPSLIYKHKIKNILVTYNNEDISPYKSLHLDTILSLNYSRQKVLFSKTTKWENHRKSTNHSYQYDRRLRNTKEIVITTDLINKYVDTTVIIRRFKDEQIINETGYNNDQSEIKFTTFYNYNDRGQLTQKKQIHKSTTSNSNINYTYTYFNNGQLKSSLEQIGANTRVTSYDKSGDLTNATYNCSPNQFGVFPFSNITYTKNDHQLITAIQLTHTSGKVATLNVNYIHYK